MYANFGNVVILINFSISMYTKSYEMKVQLIHQIGSVVTNMSCKSNRAVALICTVLTDEVSSDCLSDVTKPSLLSWIVFPQSIHFTDAHRYTTSDTLAL